MAAGSNADWGKLVPTIGLAAWEALDQVLSRPANDPWVKALQDSLSAKPLDMQSLLGPEVLAAGEDLVALWQFLDRSRRFGGYALLASNSRADFLQSPLANRLRLTCTVIRLFRSLRKLGSPLDFHRIVARVALADIRLRRRFKGADELVTQGVELGTMATLQGLAHPFEITTPEVPGNHLLLQFRQQDQGEHQVELYEVTAENTLAQLPADLPEDWKPTGKLAFYTRSRRVLIIQQDEQPEGMLLNVMTDVEVQLDGRVLYTEESKFGQIIQPRLAEPSKPIGELSENEQAYWETIQALVVVLAQSVERSPEWRHGKDGIIGYLLTAFRTLAPEGVSEYVQQVCSGFLMGRLGYLDTEDEHEQSPRANTYRDYVAKEVQNALKREANRSPKGG